MSQQDITEIISSSNFPPEIINYIFSYLKIDLSFILKLSFLNKQCYYFYDQHSFWKDNLNKFNLLTTEDIVFTKNFKQIYAILNHYLHLQKLKAQSKKLKSVKKKNKENLKTLYLAVIGQGGCGKSTLVLKFVQNILISDYDPTIEDAYRKHYKFNNESYLLEILDTAGQEEYLALQEQYMKTTEGFIFVISMIDIKYSFERFSKDIKKIIHCKEAFSFPFIVCVMKTDIVMDEYGLDEFNNRKQEIIEFVESHNILYKENIPILFTDVQSDKEVENVFQTLIEKFEMMDGMLKVTFDCKEFTEMCKLMKQNENDRDLLYESVIAKYNLSKSNEEMSMVDKKKCVMM
ncbi:hypothetical protein ABK040_006973 [Willaertia magna]